MLKALKQVDVGLGKLKTKSAHKDVLWFLPPSHKKEKPEWGKPLLASRSAIQQRLLVTKRYISARNKDDEKQQAATRRPHWLECWEEHHWPDRLHWEAVPPSTTPKHEQEYHVTNLNRRGQQRWGGLQELRHAWHAASEEVQWLVFCYCRPLELLPHLSRPVWSSSDQNVVAITSFIRP